MFQNKFFPLFVYGFLIALSATASAYAQDSVGERPALMITNTPLPQSILDRAYTSPVKSRDITAQEIIGQSYFKPSETMVSRKINALGKELAILQDKVIVLSKALNKVERANQDKAAKYYAALATIYTQLQTGTTPGNPRMLEHLNIAEATLDDLVASRATLNNLSIDTAKIATESSFLLDSARGAYGLSGAVEEDHIQLAALEDRVNSTIVMIERLLNTLTDDIERTDVYATSERDNLRSVSFAVANGNLNGMSFADRPFSGTQSATASGQSPQPPANLAAAPATPQPAMQAEPVALKPASQARPQAERPLVKISFDRSNVQYEDALVNAANEAQKRYPDVMFNVVGLHPATGNAAEVAIESTRARRNTQRVLRTLSQVGVPADRVNVVYDQSDEISVNSVFVYIY